MTDPTSPPEPATNLADEFAALGRNIKQAVQAAWTSEERKRLQAEIESGLLEASRAVKQAADDFSTSQAAQTLKAEADDFHQRVQSGELEAKIRSELLAALRMANEGLKQAFARDEAARPPQNPGEHGQS